MDCKRFDRLTRALSEAGSRRSLLGALASLPLVGGLAALLDSDAGEARGRRHKQRSGERGLTAEKKRKHKKKKKKCKPKPITTTCAGRCGQVKNNCKKTVDCDGCQNPTPICLNGACTACSAANPCPSGCCATDGSCEPGTGLAACGEDGTTCQECSGGAICAGGACLTCDVCADGCDYSTVQAAVADPSGPSTIHICPGTYTETITIARALTLLGAGQGDGAGDTILQGNGDNVVINDASAGTVTLQALRITGGTGTIGAGVRHQGNSLLTMLDCTVTGNSNTDNQGGGIGVLGGRVLNMTRCTVSGNHANGTGTGGGLRIRSNAEATLTECTVSGNTAGDDGGGIFNDGGQITLDGSTVTGNDAGDTGGGIFNTNGGTVTLSNGASVTGNDPNNCAGAAISGCSG